MLSGKVSRLRTKEIKTPLNITEEWIVKQKQTVFPQRPQQPQTIYVDGCKVTVRYAGKENPAAVREIKDILLSNVSKKP